MSCNLKDEEFKSKTYKLKPRKRHSILYANKIFQYGASLKESQTNDINDRTNDRNKDINNSKENETIKHFDSEFIKKNIEQNIEQNIYDAKITTLICCPDVNLKCKYTEIGIMRINFYDILLEKDDFIRKRTSKVFRSFSRHYAKDNMGGESQKKIIINDEYINKIRSTINYSHGSGKNLIHVNNLNSLNESEDENSKRIIRFNIFDDINTNFSQDVINNGRKIGKIDGFILINKIPSIKQIMCGVHTESGLDITANYLIFPHKSENITNSNLIDNNTLPI